MAMIVEHHPDRNRFTIQLAPDVIRTVTHEEVTKEQLGGATTHNSTSGVAHFLAHDDEECLLMLRELLSFLPNNNLDDPPRRETPTGDDGRAAALEAVEARVVFSISVSQKQHCLIRAPGSISLLLMLPGWMKPRWK